MTEPRDVTGILRDISVLYELSLSVGQSVDLYENCDEFLRTLMARKSLDFVSVWIRDRVAAEDESDAGTGLTQVYANPSFRAPRLTLPGDHPIVTAIVPVLEQALDRARCGAHTAERTGAALLALGDLTEALLDLREHRAPALGVALLADAVAARVDQALERVDPEGSREGEHHGVLGLSTRLGGQLGPQDLALEVTFHVATDRQRRRVRYVERPQHRRLGGPGRLR